jgi:hypothetical protein
MTNIKALALFSIFGKPLIVYLGLLTLIGFIVTATLGYLILKGKAIPLKYHFWLAGGSLTVALIHGFLAFSIFFK